FATIEDPAEPDIIFYRDRAPDLSIESSDVERGVVEAVPIFWFPSGALSAGPSRSTIHELLSWRGRRRHTVLDLDWRPHFWPDAATATAELARSLDCATVPSGTGAGCETAFGESDPGRAAEAWVARGMEAAIVKLGGDGVLVATADGGRERIAPYPVDVVCGLGAGDAFGGALCHGWLSGWDLPRCARAGNAAGAIVAARLMCADDMPYADEIEAVLAGTPVADVAG